MLFDLFSFSIREWSYYAIDFFQINHFALLGAAIENDLIEFGLGLDILFVSFQFSYLKKSKQKSWAVYHWFN